MVYADHVTLLGGSACSIQKNTEALVVTGKDVGKKVNANKTKYIVMSQDQNAGRRHSMKIYIISFENVEEFEYLGTTLTNQSSIREETKKRMKSGNV